MGEFVRLEVDDGVGVIRIDRPPANAIDLRVGVELGETISEAEERSDVGALVVWGGRKLFAAGADIKAMAGWTKDEVRPSVEALGDACDLLERIGKISIAAITGYALGGGLELALGCDLRYVADDARIGQPEIALGVIPGAGGTQRLARLVGAGVTRHLVYTGMQLDAATALRLGVAEVIHPAEAVFDEAVKDARSFANGPLEALAAAKHAIRAAAETPGTAGIRVERALFLDLFGTADQREGMRAFLEKREPRFGLLGPSGPVGAISRTPNGLSGVTGRCHHRSVPFRERRMVREGRGGMNRRPELFVHGTRGPDPCPSERAPGKDVTACRTTGSGGRRFARCPAEQDVLRGPRVRGAGLRHEAVEIQQVAVLLAA
jgi:enoyl-CoA hydratase